MWSNRYVQSLVKIGYPFIFRGEYCYITRLKPRGFEYGTMEKPTGNYMSFKYFQTIPHFRSKFRPQDFRQKSLDFQKKPLSLWEQTVINLLEKFPRK